MNKIFTALFISLIPLVSAHAGLVQVENRVSCNLALDGNEVLMKSSGSDIAFTKSWLHNELARHGVDQESINENFNALENELPRAYQQAAFADKCVSYYSKPANRKGDE
ncbi:hypothetical protein OA801_20890 [Citrobacter portucalensis]|nr:hypothetical protein [Citrobacter portucalensis]MDN4360189.1 hypothetical protein [Citrobacter portucalensis]MDN4365679.1 hypothetical protein [Citrobacter portucalensis]MDN4376363.1 hypothetical protein [Citrobacter portucalensis]MDN4381255.1 hypothetical protein [Citrobacter portucalensis]MDN4391316.1 hypothetical protein [Citrobacter portucalensis]